MDCGPILNIFSLESSCAFLELDSGGLWSYPGNVFAWKLNPLKLSSQQEEKRDGGKGGREGGREGGRRGSGRGGRGREGGEG